MLQGIILLCLTAMFFQDLRYREINIALPIILFISGYYLLYKKIGQTAFYIGSYNLILFLVIFLCMVIYMVIKMKSLVNPFQNYFGLGDLLFYIAVTPLFFLSGYLMFFIASMVFTVVCYFAFKKYIAKDSIPLAGFSSALLFVLVVLDILSVKNIIIAL
ncbi:hypothetical protein ACLI08_16205 [Flavobacterium sp. RNTU_13]|uniref:hypothetical protein n=1 Tax=Flavobacterium sp. RNTU_13 TaxID=3375145 RepID=UPI003986D368